MNMRPFTGRCHTCGHDHDADVTTLRDVLDITDKARDAEIAALRAEIHLLRILEKSLPVCQKENDGLRAAATSLVEQNNSLRAEVERLRKDAERSVGKTAARCREMAMWPQGIDDEQAYYGSMFAEFITKEFGAAIDAAMRQEPKA